MKMRIPGTAQACLKLVTLSALCVLVLLFLSTTVRADALDTYARNQVKDQRIAGLSLAVVKDGKIVKAKGYGLANLETGTAASANTVYKIGSVSKSFFAAAIMLLAEDGKLTLDDTIDHYFPDAPAAWKVITIRQLLSHTSGIVEDPPGFTPFKLQPDADVVKSLYTVPLLFKPGEQWSYSNAAYFAVADIIRQASREPWPDFMEDRVFRPLHMTSTRVTTTTEVVHNRAEGYVFNDGRFTKAEDWVAVRPSGAFLSTVVDLAKWDRAVRQRTLLTSSSWDQILTPVKLNSGKTYPYGFGFFLDPWQGHRDIHHDGGLPGFETIFEDFPDDRLSVLMILNTDEVDHFKLAHSIAGFYVPALAPPTYKAIGDTNPEITAKVRQFIESSIGGNPDRSLFPEDRRDHFTDEVRTRLKNRFGKWGPVQSLTLVERAPQGGQGIIYRYRISYRDADSLLLQVFFNPQDLILGWNYETDTSPSSSSARPKRVVGMPPVSTAK
jgi:CubicO group peptidase (beta-lactamase class C family)